MTDAMRLELGTYEIRDVVWDPGAPPRVEEGVLHVDPQELRRILLRDHRLKDVSIAVARPGDQTRIIHILDVVEPRVKVRGARSAFPGLLGPVEPAGRGRTHRLGHVAVMSTVEEFWVHDGVSIKEAVVDMAGPGAAYSPFASTINVVVSCAFSESATVPERGPVVTLAGLRAAEYLGSAAREAAPERVETWELSRVPLPRVGYVCFLMAEGLIHRSYVYGADVPELPTLLHPQELLDGAVVSGDFHSASFRNVTYLQQNNPVVHALMARHGQEIDFAGVIVAKALAPHPEVKQRIAQHCATLAEMLGLRGVVISQDSGGNATVDLMRTCQALERRGIPTVLLAEECAGSDGGDLSLVHYVPEAAAMVSTGNRDEIVQLPRMERVLGGREILNPDANDTIVAGPASESFETSLRRILSATNQVGSGRVTTWPADEECAWNS